MSQQSDQVVHDEILLSVAEAIRGLRFGEVHITVHDSRIVRIDRVEKIRVEPVLAKGRDLKGGGT